MRGRVRRFYHAATVAILVLVGVGCIQQIPSGPQGQGGVAPSASTRLAVQADRIAALETADAELAAEVTRQAAFISYLATRIPPYYPTPRPGPPTPFSEFEGSLSIEGGRCCVGGVAGQETSIVVDFNAESPFATVTEMRVVARLGSLPENAIERANWEPFVSTKTYAVTPPINWVGFYVAVQYRDGVGNLSRVFRGDISVEGTPPTPSAIPGS